MAAIYGAAAFPDGWATVAGNHPMGERFPPRYFRGKNDGRRPLVWRAPVTIMRPRPGHARAREEA